MALALLDPAGKFGTTIFHINNHIRERKHPLQEFIGNHAKTILSTCCDEVWLFGRAPQELCVELIEMALFVNEDEDIVDEDIGKTDEELVKLDTFGTEQVCWVWFK